MKEVVFSDHYKISIPLIQGGMGVGISLGNLAGHVALNGGMGVISTAHPGYREDDFEVNTLNANVRALKKEIKKAKDIAQSHGMVAVNAMVAIKDYDEMIQASLEAGIDAIISGAGLPLRLPQLVEGHDVMIAPIVSSGKACRLVLRSWNKKYHRCADFVVIEGSEAGGHLGFKKDALLNHTVQPLDQIFLEVKEVVKEFEAVFNKHIPIFVAGGIYTKEDIQKYLALGVDGVQMATRFITTYECDASDLYKQMFINAKKEDIELVTSPVGMPGRAIKNKLTETIKTQKIPVKKCYQCLVPCDVKTTPYCISKALIEACKGNIDEGLIFSGSNGYRSDKLVSVKDLIAELMGD
ncbi:nitronate monooxygenase [[Clostridium] spiroforme]|nr:nitronate monooxygenase [Thomasclavelia spiroformis]MBM6879440.1 nitronate monooxygenase [Thomasclavelia spiroformis]MBM6929856.1 nitronate monooxygenase [Thomasclavelia spiroformis]